MTSKMSYSDFLDNKVKFYAENKEKKFEFEKQILPLLQRFHTEDKPERIKTAYEVLTVVDKYSNIIFSPYSSYNTQFVDTIKNKLMEFKNIPILETKCRYMLDKYYDEYCKAFTLKHRRCGNKISYNKSKYFCGTHHQKYVPKVLGLVKTELSTDVAKMCVEYVF